MFQLVLNAYEGDVPRTGVVQRGVVPSPHEACGVFVRLGRGRVSVALFGGVYAWLALQPQFNRALVIVGGLGKLGFFCLTVAYCVAGAVPLGMALSATPDLVVAAIFLWWARAAG